MPSIIFAGDFCPRNRVNQLIEGNDSDTILSEIKPYLKTADYSVVNFECPLVSHPIPPLVKNGPNLKCSIKALEFVKNNGFDMVTLANNHILDYGESGVAETICACEKLHIDYVGAGENIQSASKILYKTIENKRVAFINCCEHEFSIATEKTSGANPLHPIQQYYKIQEAKSKSDYIIVIVHGGHEHYQLPSPRMIENYRYFIDLGASAVINHHQHCYSGYEIYHGKPIFYGLGNFCFDWEGKRKTLWNEGYLVNLKLNETEIGFEIIPYNQCDAKATVRPMNASEKAAFDQQIEKLNHTIGNKELLHKNYTEFLSKSDEMYNMSLTPYSNRYLKAACYRHLLPSFVSLNRLLVIKNYIECEAHLDRFRHAINTLIEKKK